MVESRGRRILIVEDEAILGLELAALLEEYGMVPIGPAGNSADALRLLDETPVDAALLDVNLQGQPAVSVAARLRERGIPFAILTGYGSAGLPPVFQAVPLLTKPFNARALVDVVRRIRS